VSPGGRRRGWWADEVRVDEAKLVAAASGLEGSQKWLASLRCSQRKVDSAGWLAVGSEQRPTVRGRGPSSGGA
jgi:hypothetical protein